MGTVITQNSIEIVSRLIRNEFDKLSDVDIILGEADKLIQTARDYNLHELANQMKADIN